MRLLILSDLHLEQSGDFIVDSDLVYDAVVLAGDIYSVGTRAIQWAKSWFASTPVLLVPGNHEFYGCTLELELLRMQVETRDSNVHLLDRSAIELGGIRFLGCTLWTDFQLPIEGPDGSVGAPDVEHALEEANSAMNDFRQISVALRSHGGVEFFDKDRPLLAEDTLARHWIERDWLRRELLEPFSGRTVVVTHHAPSMESVASRWRADWCTPAFVSNLPDSFFEVPTLWVHGHTHSSFDYHRGKCRVVANPRGYRTWDGGFENPQFRSDYVVDL